MGQAALDFFSEWKSVYIDYSGKLQRAQIDMTFVDQGVTPGPLRGGRWHAPSAAMRLPVLPAHTVVFPHLPLPIHVFEERYRRWPQDLVADGRRSPGASW